MGIGSRAGFSFSGGENEQLRGDGLSPDMYRRSGQCEKMLIFGPQGLYNKRIVLTIGMKPGP